MSRSTVFWDTRCVLTRFACRKSVGQATSRRSAGDASARTFRSDIVLLSSLREEAKEAGAGTKFQTVFCRGQAPGVYRPKSLTPEDP